MLKKIIDSVEIEDLEVLTDTGWVEIKKIHKTVPYKIYTIKTKNFKLQCADRHIVFDENMNEIFVKDLKIGDKIKTINGDEEIIFIDIDEKEENMFDLELSENSNRRYYTNGILSHNTLIMTSLCADYLRQGYNVLYFTFEMSEEKIAERIDANLLDIPLDLLKDINKEKFLSKVKSLKEKIKGNFIIKEYPSASVSTLQLQTFIEQLEQKKKFKPDIIIVDYLNIMLPIRVSAHSNTYVITKYISEELRGLAQKTDTVVWTATQINRDGFKSTNFDLDKTAEGFGINFIADLVLGVVQSDEMKQSGFYMFNHLKSRYADKSRLPKFKIAVNTSKMKVYDYDEGTEANIDRVVTNTAKNFFNKRGL